MTVDQQTRAADLTAAMRRHLDEVTSLGKERRRLWHEANRSGITQDVLAAAAGVTKQTVYMEIRRYRETGS